MRLRIFTDSASCWANQTLKLCLDRWNFYSVILNLVASLVTQLSRGLSSAFFPLKNESNYLCLWEQWEQQCTKYKNIWNHPQENYREATAAVSVPTNYPFTDRLLELLTWVNDTAERQSERPIWLSPHWKRQLSLFVEEFCSCWSLLKTLIQ